VDCKVHNLGKLLFGSSYRRAGKFDLDLAGYEFAVPSVMVKTEPRSFLLQNLSTVDRTETVKTVYLWKQQSHSAPDHRLSINITGQFLTHQQQEKENAKCAVSLWHMVELELNSFFKKT
jgi:hypothetical protein